MGAIKIDEIKALTAAERLTLIEQIWDSLVDSPEHIPVPDWQLDEIKARRDELERGLDSGSSWEDVEARLTRTK